MHLDARTPNPPLTQWDLCVIGAGPAGITIARALDGSGISVALLESGGFDPDPQVQRLASGQTVGDPLRPPVEANRRQFGGNSNLWYVNLGGGVRGLRHALLDESDFEPRAAVGGAAWPMRRAHLMPWYERAQAAVGAGEFGYTPQSAATPQAAPWALGAQQLESGVFRFSDGAVFYRDGRQALERSRNVTLYTHATAIELVPDAQGRRVTSVRVARPGAKPFELSARAVVLAAGGYENARLLLLSNRQHPAGLGNAHDQVGRHYHDHLQARSGWLLPADRNVLDRSGFYDFRQVAGGPAMGYLRPAAALLEREGLPNINTMLFPRPGPRQARAIELFNAMRWRWRNPALAIGTASVIGGVHLAELLEVARGLDYVLVASLRALAGRQSTAYGQSQGGWSKVRELGKRFDRFELWHIMEQVPRPENRVMLGQQRDMFGCAGLEVHWRWPLEERRLAARAQDLVAAALRSAGLGRVELDRGPQGEAKLHGPAGSNHLMGTTRMHVDPRKGVVDPDCRVHGLENLYVAGSSVFPTGGHANPTLTLVALALRLADHLRPLLARPA